MTDTEITAQKRITALALMEQALRMLEEIEEYLGAMRLQHAIDIVRLPPGA